MSARVPTRGAHDRLPVVTNGSSFPERSEGRGPDRHGEGTWGDESHMGGRQEPTQQPRIAGLAQPTGTHHPRQSLPGPGVVNCGGSAGGAPLRTHTGSASTSHTNNHAAASASRRPSLCFGFKQLLLLCAPQTQKEGLLPPWATVSPSRRPPPHTTPSTPRDRGRPGGRAGRDGERERRVRPKGYGAT